jgi:hypothetical protein
MRIKGLLNFGFCAFFVCSAIGKFRSGTETGWTYLTLALAAVGVAFSAYALFMSSKARAARH